YSTLFEQSPFGYVVLDLRGFVKQHNQAFASMVVLKSGYARIGPFARFVRRADLDKFLQHLNKAASGRKTVRTELSLRNTGEPLPVELITVRLEKPSAGGSTLLNTAVIDIPPHLAHRAAFEMNQPHYQLLKHANRK